MPSCTVHNIQRQHTWRGACDPQTLRRQELPFITPSRATVTARACRHGPGLNPAAVARAGPRGGSGATVTALSCRHVPVPVGWPTLEVTDGAPARRAAGAGGAGGGAGGAGRGAGCHLQRGRRQPVVAGESPGFPRSVGHGNPALPATPHKYCEARPAGGVWSLESGVWSLESGDPSKLESAVGLLAGHSQLQLRLCSPTPLPPCGPSHSRPRMPRASRCRRPRRP